MVRAARDITDAELRVLQQLWRNGPSTVRQLTDALYPGGGQSEYATVQKLLERLEAKGFASRRRGDPVLVFTATVDRDELIGRKLRTLAEKLCDGSLAPLLTHLVQGQVLSEADLEPL